jgi:hypothetical protein
LAGIHAPAQFIAGGPKGGIEVGFLDGHALIVPAQAEYFESPHSIRLTDALPPEYCLDWAHGS